MAAEQKLRVAVIGVGHLGTYHARIYNDHPQVELVAVVDPNAEKAQQLAQELGCKALSDPSELATLDVQAASVAVPTAFHAGVSVPLLESGIPLLVEKPLASNLEQADQILEAAERGGAALAVGHVERFQPGVKRLRELGMRPRFIECHRLSPFSFRSMDVGVVHDLMIHDLDLVLDMVDDEVVSIDAAGGAILTEREDVASVRLVFAGGARANVTASRASLKPMRRFRMFSSEGYVSLDFTENYGLMVRKADGWDEGRAKLAQLAVTDPQQLAALAAKAGGNMDGMLDIDQLELGGDERPLKTVARLWHSQSESQTPFAPKDGR
jgi:predicted dehydrogenase